MFVSNVSALGVTPARTTVDFEPGLQRSVTFSVINSEKRDVDIVIATQGELKNNILVHGDKFSMTSAEESRQVTYE